MTQKMSSISDQKAELKRLTSMVNLSRSSQRSRWEERQSYLRPLEATFMPKRVRRMQKEAEKQAARS